MFQFRSHFCRSAIAQYKGAALEPVLESAFRKISGQLDDSVRYSLRNLEAVVSIRPFGPGDAKLEKFELLIRAIREKRVLQLRIGSVES